MSYVSPVGKHFEHVYYDDQHKKAASYAALHYLLYFVSALEVYSSGMFPSSHSDLTHLIRLSDLTSASDSIYTGFGLRFVF